MGAWNTADAGANITISNGGATAANAVADWDSVRADLVKTTGKWYYEVVVDALPATNYLIVGFCNGTDSVASYLTKLMLFGNGDKWINGSQSSCGAPLSVGDVVHLAVDCDTGKFWAGVDGVWYAGGDPAAGTGQLGTLTMPSYLPALSLYGGAQATATFSGGTYKPVGFGAIGQLYAVSGSVHDHAGAACARTVRLHRRDTGAVLGDAVSNETTGAFAIETDYLGDCYMVAFDDDSGADYNALIFDRVTPV